MRRGEGVEEDGKKVKSSKTASEKTGVAFQTYLFCASGSSISFRPNFHMTFDHILVRSLFSDLLSF